MILSKRYWKMFFRATCKKWVRKTFRLNEIGICRRYAADRRTLTLKIVLLTIPAYTYLPHKRFFHLFPRLKLLCCLNSLSAEKWEIFLWAWMLKFWRLFFNGLQKTNNVLRLARYITVTVNAFAFITFAKLSVCDS